MGDIAVVAAKVAAIDPAKSRITSYQPGVTITAGQSVYGIVASGLLGLADEDASAEASACLGIALNGSAVGGPPVDVISRGPVAGFTVSALAYWLPVSLSNTAGALLDDGTATGLIGRIVPMNDKDLTKVLEVDCGVGKRAAFA
jgi:hypothetical protein